MLDFSNANMDWHQTALKAVAWTTSKPRTRNMNVQQHLIVIYGLNFKNLPMGTVYRNFYDKFEKEESVLL